MGRDINAFSVMRDGSLIFQASLQDTAIADKPEITDYTYVGMHVGYEETVLMYDMPDGKPFEYVIEHPDEDNDEGESPS